MSSYQVKGSTIQSKFDFVEAHFGSVASQRMVDAFKAKHGDFLFPILNSQWYDYDLYTEILEYIANEHYTGALSRLEAVGAESAKAALSTTYRSFLNSSNFLKFLSRMAKLHHMFYNRGVMTVDIQESKNRCEIDISEKPKFATADLYVASGFYQEAARLHQLTDIQCTFRTTPDGAKFTLEWRD